MSSSSAISDRAERATLFLQDSELDLVEFDAILSETHQGDAVVTDHPVEDGVDISDHVRRQPESLTCRIIVSNHPIIIERSNNAQPSVRGTDPNSRAEEAYRFIKATKDAGKVVRFTTTLRDYRNMIIVATATTRDSNTGNILDMTLTIREITTASTDTAEVPEPVNPSRKTKTNLGKKPKVTATPAVEKKTESVLRSIFSPFG